MATGLCINKDTLQRWQPHFMIMFTPFFICKGLKLNVFPSSFPHWNCSGQHAPKSIWAPSLTSWSLHFLLSQGSRSLPIHLQTSSDLLAIYLDSRFLQFLFKTSLSNRGCSYLLCSPSMALISSICPTEVDEGKWHHRQGLGVLSESKMEHRCVLLPCGLEKGTAVHCESAHWCFSEVLALY